MSVATAHRTDRRGHALHASRADGSRIITARGDVKRSGVVTYSRPRAVELDRLARALTTDGERVVVLSSHTTDAQDIRVYLTTTTAKEATR